ncbi:phage integrase family protein [Azospirillum brasilense]|nr:phage integrase family protein [Azospirillum brasilense]
MRMQLKNVKAYRSKGKVYYYHRPTRTRLRAEFGTPEFVREVEALNHKMAERADVSVRGTLGALIVAYRRSPEWAEKAIATKDDYQAVFDYLKIIDDMPLALLDGPAVITLRDKAFAAHKRRFANYVVQVLSLVFNWGKSRGFSAINPASDVPKLKRPKSQAAANRPWTIDEFRIVMMALPPELRVPVALGAYAGLREGDAVNVLWSTYDGTAIESRQLKTGDPLWVPAHRDLRDILDAERTRRSVTLFERNDTIVVGARGKKLTEAGFRSRFFKVIRELVREEWVRPGLTFQGLRHTAATLLAEAGCDVKDIQAITGHKTVAMAEHYARRANLRKRAVAAVDRLEAAFEILPTVQVVGIRAEAALKPVKFKVKVAAAPVAPRNGSSSPNAVLTEADVLAIRASTESQRKLAALYGVSRSLIEQIKSGKVWRHLLPQATQEVPSEHTPNT